MSRTYRRQSLVLGLFARDFPQHGIVEGKVFEDCMLLGPAVAFFERCKLVRSGFGVLGGIDSILWEVPQGKEAIVGALMFLGCTFHDCSFEGVGIACRSAVEMSRWRAHLGELQDPDPEGDDRGFPSDPREGRPD